MEKKRKKQKKTHLHFSGLRAALTNPAAGSNAGESPADPLGPAALTNSHVPLLTPPAQLFDWQKR